MLGVNEQTKESVLGEALSERYPNNEVNQKGYTFICADCQISLIPCAINSLKNKSYFRAFNKDGHKIGCEYITVKKSSKARDPFSYYISNPDVVINLDLADKPNRKIRAKAADGSGSRYRSIEPAIAKLRKSTSYQAIDNLCLIYMRCKANKTNENKDEFFNSKRINCGTANLVSINDLFEDAMIKYNQGHKAIISGFIGKYNFEKFDDGIKVKFIYYVGGKGNESELLINTQSWSAKSKVRFIKELTVMIANYNIGKNKCKIFFLPMKQTRDNNVFEISRRNHVYLNQSEKI